MERRLVFLAGIKSCPKETGFDAAQRTTPPSSASLLHVHATRIRRHTREGVGLYLRVPLGLIRNPNLNSPRING